MKKLFLLAAVISAAIFSLSCNQSKIASRKLDKALRIHTPTIVKKVNQLFPCTQKTSNTDSSEYWYFMNQIDSIENFYYALLQSKEVFIVDTSSEASCDSAIIYYVDKINTLVDFNNALLYKLKNSKVTIRDTVEDKRKIQLMKYEYDELYSLWSKSVEDIKKLKSDIISRDKKISNKNKELWTYRLLLLAFLTFNVIRFLLKSKAKSLNPNL